MSGIPPDRLELAMQCVCLFVTTSDLVEKSFLYCL